MRTAQEPTPLVGMGVRNLHGERGRASRERGMSSLSGQ